MNRSKELGGATVDPAAVSGATPKSAATNELLEAAKGLSFGAYPAHGSGFVCVVEGELGRFRDALAVADEERG